jgi:hypothetical protein
MISILRQGNTLVEDVGPFSIAHKINLMPTADGQVLMMQFREQLQAFLMRMSRGLKYCVLSVARTWAMCLRANNSLLKTPDIASILFHWCLSQIKKIVNACYFTAV